MEDCTQKMTRPELIDYWTPLAYVGAHRFRKTQIPEEDRNQEAMLALILAVDNYNPRIGAFKSYAARTINNRLVDMCASQLRPFRIPHRLNHEVVRIRKARQLLATRGDFRPTTEAVALLARVAPKIVVRVDALHDHRVPHDPPARPEADPGPDERIGLIADEIGALPAAQSDLLTRRFGLAGEAPTPFAALGIAMGVSTTQANREVRKAVTAVRQGLRRLGHHVP